MTTSETDIATPETEGATAEKHVNDLPDELLRQILGYLPQYDLVRNASAVCWRWHEAAFDKDLWKMINVCIDDKMSVQDLSRLLKSSTLEELYVKVDDETRLDVTFANMLKTCSSLEILRLGVHVCAQKSQQDSTTTDSVAKVDKCKPSPKIALKSIGYLHLCLQELSLASIDRLTVGILKSILRGCKNLKYLEVFHCKNLSTSALTAIGKYAPQLKGVLILFPKHICVSNQSVHDLVDGCPMLELLGLQAHTTTMTDFNCIGQLKNLRTIYIKISNAPIDDDTVVHWLTECKTLTSMSVQHQYISDKSLAAMASLGCNLRIVRICISSEITDQGLKLLAKSKTMVSITFYSHDLISITPNGIVQLVEDFKTLEHLSIHWPCKSPFFKDLKKMIPTWKRVYPTRLSWYRTDGLKMV